MKTIRVLGLLLFSFLVCQSCSTTSQKRTIAKRNKVSVKNIESYALMEDWEKLDKEVLKRGNRARGLSEY